METVSMHPQPKPNVEKEILQPDQKLVNSEPQRQPRSLLSLPVELQLHILPFLDYQSLRNLSQTSKHLRFLFANSISRDIIKKTLLALESDAQQRSSVLLGRELLLPCYRCLRILHSRDRFSNVDTYKTTRHELGGDHAQSRRCMSCRYTYLTDSGQSELFVRSGQCWIACVGCRQVKLYVASTEVMKVAWTMSRKCMECAKVEMARDEGKKEVWKDLMARHHRWKQAAVVRQEPGKMATISTRLAEGSPKLGKRSSQAERWSTLRRLFKPAR
jgi:F-box-like